MSHPSQKEGFCVMEREQDGQIEQQIPNGRKDLPDLLEEELLRMNGGSVEVIQIALIDWVANERKKAKFDSNLVVVVESRITEGDITSALLAMVDAQKTPPIHGSMRRTVKGIRKRIGAVTSGIQNPTLEKGRASRALPMGGAAHNINEPIQVARSSEKLVCNDFSLVVENGMAVGMIENKGNSALNDVYTQLEFGRTVTNTPENNKTKQRIVSFEYPIPAPIESQTRVDWAVSVFLKTFAVLVEEHGAMPAKPYDIEQIFENPQSTGALMQGLEAAHFLFGGDHGLDLTRWNNDGKAGALILSEVPEFPTLNWLAIMRTMLNLVYSSKIGNDKEAALIELMEGDMLITSDDVMTEKFTETFKGNKVDIIRLNWSDGSSAAKDQSLLDLRTAVEVIINAKFNSQETRYRRKAVRDGVLKEVSTLNFRNVRTLFKELYKIYGERIFTDLEIKVDDLKFPAGDGGWFEQYNPEDLPLDKHVSQVSGYLYKIMAQLYWVKQWSALQDPKEFSLISPDDADNVGKLERFSLKVSDIASFIVQYKLTDRIRGRLLYQLPGEEICKEIIPPDLMEEVVRWGKEVFDIAGKLETRDRLRVLRAIERVLKPNIQRLNFIEREVKVMPKELSSICVEFEGNVYLCIERLWEVFNKRFIEDPNLAEITNMVVFQEWGTKVVWIDDLLEGTYQLRIAVDKNGNYSISYNNGMDKIYLRGRLLSSVRMKGVHEQSSKLALLFEGMIWQKVDLEWGLFKPGLSDLLNLIDGGSAVVFPDGSVREVVPGKPVICLWDPMGGGWYLDPQLLKEAIETDSSHRDTWGYNQLGDLVNGRYRGEASILCPIPSHANRDKTSMAGHWYGEGDAHITCFGECNTAINLARALHVNRGSIKVEPMATGETVDDFRPPSTERQKTFATTMNFASTMERNLGIAKRYLIEERGLAPDDVGEMGFVPMELAKGLADLVASTGFRHLLKANNHLGLDSLLGALKTYQVDWDPKMESALSHILFTMNEVGNDDRRTISSILTTGALDEMRRRGVIESKRRLKDDQGVVREPKIKLGGRLILPTYFIDPSRKGLASIVRSNMNARGIILDGEELFEGNPHHKARIRQGELIRNGVRLLNTPAGFWARDWPRFLDAISEKKEIILSEGPMDPPSFGRMNHEYRDNVLTNIGFNYHYLFPALRYFGMFGDENSPGQGFGMGIKRIFLAYDFDLTGARKFHDRVQKLGILFPKVEVLSIHTLLPEDVLAVVPPYDIGLFSKGDANKDQEDGLFFGTKLDFNGIINISAEADPVLKLLREKYAYRP